MTRRGLIPIGGVGFALLVLLPLPLGLKPEAQVVLATALLMAIWWIGEALPIPATALVPLVVFPLFGVEPARSVASSYMDPNIVLFLGGFLLAAAVERWDLHRRAALRILFVLGTNRSRTVLGFMVATALISMLVSNTATAIMMLPIGVGMISHLRDQGLGEESRFPVTLMLALAYAASIGGVGTLIGTPPNLVFAAQLQELFPARDPVTFVQWMGIGLPFVIVFLPLGWLYLTRVFAPLAGDPFPTGRALIRKELDRLGPTTSAEKRVAGVFGLTAVGWIFRADLPLGALTIPGWAPWLGVESYVHDSTVAVLGALMLFLLPSGTEPDTALLRWEDAAEIPWGILILFGGGIALAGGFQSSGLSRWMAQHLEWFYGVPTLLMVALICLMMTFLTEVTSNTATATLFMPVLGGAAGGLGLAPEVLMIPAAVSASCAFMLPVATPPNAIVFGSNELRIPEMSRAGFWMNLIGVALTTLLAYLLIIPVFGALSG